MSDIYDVLHIFMDFDVPDIFNFENVYLLLRTSWCYQWDVKKRKKWMNKKWNSTLLETEMYRNCYSNGVIFINCSMYFLLLRYHFIQYLYSWLFLLIF